MDVHQVNSRAIHDTDPELVFPTTDNDNNPGGDNLEKRQTVRSTASYEETYPEGGTRAWLVVLGSWFAMIASMGLMNSVAVYQAYTLSHQLKGHSEGTVGWIFSIYTFLAFFGGVYTGPVFDKYGPTWLVIAGIACTVVALVGMSFCTGESEMPSLISFTIAT